jgi:hypothetical protein
MSKYNLRTDVKSVLASTSLTDPGEVADKVAESMPANALRAALRVTLRSYVRQIMSEERTSSADQTSTGSGQRTSDAQSRSAAAGRSSKVRAIRDGWKRHLEDRVHVGSEWMLLGDCTHDNLIALATEREEIAAKTEAWAQHYRRLAGLVAEHGVAQVRDLPAEVLAPAIGAAA